MQNHPLELFHFCPKCGSRKFEINNAKSKKCSVCGFTYYFNASSAVVGFIRNDAGDLLVCRRAKNPAKGTLDLPGGFVDMQETAEQALIREIQEELNLQADELKYCFSLPNIYPYSGFEVHTLDMFFECKVTDFSALKATDDVAEAFFIPLKDIDPEQFGLESIKEGIRKICF